MPSLDTIYAGRTIYNGLKNAFIDLGHEFLPLTADDNLEEMLSSYDPDILITGSHFYYQKYLDFNLLKKYRDKGMVVFTSVGFWKTLSDRNRINEACGLEDDLETVNLIKNNLLGDIFFNVVEQGDERMIGFEKETGYKYYTIPLAADKIFLKKIFDEKFRSEISFIGTYLPKKRDLFKKYVFPLKDKYLFRLYGQDWTFFDRILGWVQRGGQYLNIPCLRSIRKPKLQIADEAKIYKSSLVSINIHEDHQREFGGDCNERTFKIPLCGGFEISDDVACIKKYFVENEEIIIAHDEEDWFKKIDYYIKNPDKRLEIIRAGRKKVLEEHTYHNRVQQILDIYQKFKYPA